jgi:hypothetical protein
MRDANGLSSGLPCIHLRTVHRSRAFGCSWIVISDLQAMYETELSGEGIRWKLMWRTVGFG